MPSGVYSLPGLTYAGVDLLRADLSVALRITRGLGELMEVRGTDTVIPSAAGRIRRNRVKDRLAIELDGFVMGFGETDAAQRSSYVALRAELRALFDSTLPARPLVATREDGSRLTINAAAVNLLWDSDDANPTFRDVSVELESYEDWSLVV